MSPIKQTCATCRHFEESRLKSYGYCKAAPTLETLARLRVEGGQCAFEKWVKK